VSHFLYVLENSRRNSVNDVEKESIMEVNKIVHEARRQSVLQMPHLTSYKALDNKKDNLVLL